MNNMAANEFNVIYIYIISFNSYNNIVKKRLTLDFYLQLGILKFRRFNQDYSTNKWLKNMNLFLNKLW